MRKIILTLTAIFTCAIAHAETETIHWYAENGEAYATTTCESGGDIILPKTPYKYGYTFQGWLSYLPVEYLESTGTQWIDTGIVPTKNIKIDIDLQLTSIISAKYVFGSWAPDKQYYLYISDNKWQWGWSSEYKNTTTTDQNRHNFILASNGTISSITLDGNVIGTTTTTSQYPGPNFSIFGGRGQSNIVNTDLTQKIYSCKIFENNVLVRDFIPVLDPDGTPCMYDKVTKTFFYNQGTGDFIAGPVINQ